MRTLQEVRVTEDVVERHLVKSVTALRGIAIKAERLMTGFPDRLVILPGGVQAYFELKRPVGGKFEKMQPLVHRRLRRLGCRVYVCKTKQEVNEALEELCEG